ncbi:MAG TPA: dihydrodipicolinate synthase family protein [Acidimicrobiales bacterium]|nr:dihydrodipicolinate synthase family protein [Acidimicrobiales bacterium]
MTAAQPVFTGVAVALLTFFDDDGDLDAAASAEHAARLVDLGVRAVVVAGSTGEAATLEPAERLTLLDAVCGPGGVDGRVPVVAGTGAPSARQAAALTAAAADHGADAVLALSPPGTDDPRRYYDQVTAAAGGVSVLAYHFPAVSAPGIPVAALADLAVAGCKDSSGDPDRLLQTLSEWDRPLYVGTSALLALAGPLGCPGAIVTLANAQPELCVAAFAGDAAAQLELAPHHRAAGVRLPVGIKELTHHRFGTPTTVRVS